MGNVIDCCILFMYSMFLHQYYYLLLFIVNSSYLLSPAVLNNRVSSQQWKTITDSSLLLTKG